ncbi:MAG: pyrroloquinoline quinone-dependent dehydrogenase, partial [Rhizomicrobium sp.]
MKGTLLAAASLMALAGPALAQTGGRNVDWPVYTGDLSGSRYKPLDQINASNFSNLEVAWRFKTDNIGNRPEYKLEGTP